MRETKTYFKRIVSILFTIWIVLFVDLQSIIMLSSDVSAATFTPRTTAPAKNNKYYYSNINPFYKSGYGMPNCTCYAYGRAYEILGKDPKLPTGNAGTWYNKDKRYKHGNTPKLGAIACWKAPDSNPSKYNGHVAVVEEINGNKITISESNYGGETFVCRKNFNPNTYATNAPYNYKFQGYIYITDDPDPYVEIPQDHYYIKNASTGTYLNISGGKAANGQAAVLSAKKDENSFKFQAKGSKDAGYNLISWINNKYVLNAYSDTPADGCKVTLYENLNNSTQKFKFEKSGNGYIIHNAYNENIVLTPSGSNVLLKTKTGAANQVWTLESAKKQLTGISIATPATKGHYWCNETVPTAEITAGLSLKATYSDGSTKNINSGFTPKCDFSNVGTSTITISYTEDSITKTTSYNVTVGYPFSGEGTASNPFLISNQDELFRLARIINNTRYSSYNNRYYKQTADIDLENKEWTPIGTAYENSTSSNFDNTRVFNGNYNGDYHKIIGLNVNYNRYYAGLFGRTNPDAVIENLSVNGSVNNTDIITGGIVGEMGYGSTIKYCDFTGTVKGTQCVGGIAGKIQQGGTISACYVNGNITATSEGANAGGIVSAIYIGGYEDSVNAVIENCYFAGEVNAAVNGAFSSNINAGTANKSTASFYSNYYLENSASGAVGGKEQSGCQKFSSEKLKNAADYLGYPYVSVSINQNDGYPVFEWQKETQLGDLDDDKKVSVSDATLLQKYLVNAGKLTETQYKLADMNGDGKVDVFDFIILKRIVLKTI